MPTLVIKGPDGTEQEQDFADQLTVGRAEGNDLILAEGGVSRKHARFFLEGDALMVEDLGSANGTIVNGERIEGPTALDATAAIILGDYEVSLKGEDKPSRAKVDKAQAKPSNRGTQALKRPASLAAKGERSTKVMPVVKPAAGGGGKRPARAGSSGPTLRGLSGTVTGKNFPLTGVMVVGRVAGVDLRVDDDSVSRRHAEVEVKGGEVVLRDLGSANGTTVNGSPITEDTTLSAGDIIQFGVVELMYENGSASGSKPAVRPSRGGAPARPGRRSMTDEPSDSLSSEAAAPMDPKKKRLFIIGGTVLSLLFVAVVAKGLTGSSDEGKPTDPTNPVIKPPPPVDPAEQIDELLKVCRTYASCEGRQPDWAKAEAACGEILDLEPIHAQAGEMMKRIKHERVAEEAYLKGKELSAAGRRDAALESFAKVKPFSKEIMGCYFLETLSTAKPVIEEAKKAAALECKTYASNGRWEQALRSCEDYMKLACQSMTREQLVPPPTQQLKLDGPLGRNDWRPADANFINFLKARAKLKPGDAPWVCPEVPVFRPPAPPPDPEIEIFKEFKARYSYEEAFATALILYFKGGFAEARVPVQRVIETVSKANRHDEARDLLLDIDNAASFFRTGQTELSNDKPEKAEEAFRKALALDEKLVLGDKAAKLNEEQRRKEIEKRASFLRKGIVEGMSSTCYQKGKALAEKKDFRAACRVWKLGLSFSRANADLLRAGYFCTQKAGEALKRGIDSCAALAAVRDLAVDGDGYKDEIDEMAIKNGCK